MTRFLLPLALALALAVTAFTLQTPRPAPANAPDVEFSATRAMQDIRRIAQAPHPTGSSENARVRAYLLDRMRGLGLETLTQEAALSPDSIERLAQWGDEAAATRQLVNLIGVLPGQDRSLPAVMMMAHHDTTRLSPGAADDSTGVAAALEAVRAIRARGPARRDVVILLTDAEELGLDGARAFFGGHPLADRIGFVVNLEARGGGGLATMFETGPGNAETVAAYAAAMRGAPGGPVSNSAGVVVYENMPNGTDYTIARERGIAGANFAFTGRAGHYHTAESTPGALDQGSVQHMGVQALALTDRLARADVLPVSTRPAVYSDLLGAGMLAMAPAWGWGLLFAAAVMAGIAAWRARRAGELSAAGFGRGVLDGLALVATGLVAGGFVRALAGGPVETGLDYYTMMGRLLWLEGGVALGLAGIALALLAGGAVRRRYAIAAVVVMAVASMAVLGFSLVSLIAAGVAAGLWLWPRRGEPQTWGGWLGLMGLVFVMGCVAQVLAPEAALFFVWTVTLAAAAALAGSLIDPGLRAVASLVPALVVAVAGGAWVMGMGHFVALGVGMDLPGALGLFALLVLMLVRPLAGRGRKSRQVMAMAAAVCLVAAAVVSATARVAEPASADMPGYKAGVSD